MSMTEEVIDISGRRCHVVAVGINPDAVIVKPLGEFERRLLLTECEMIAERSASASAFVMVAFEVTEHDLRPSDMDNTFLYLKDCILPYIHSAFSCRHVVVGGYSLGGLFSLWSATKLDGIDAVFAGSPSLWIDGWDEYADAHPVKSQYVFMSLGNKEECTRKMPYSIIGDRVRRQHERHLACMDAQDCVLQWNEGGHFNDIETRKADGFAWCMNKLKDKE